MSKLVAARPPDETIFAITSRRLECGILVAPSGELDLATAPIVERELRRAEESHDYVVLDLGKVSFIDSAGLAMILAAGRRIRELSRRFVAIDCHRQIQRLFELTGVVDRPEIVSAGEDLGADGTLSSFGLRPTTSPDGSIRAAEVTREEN